SPAQVQDLYQWKLDSGLSRSTVQLIHATLHKALKQAMKRGLVARNVTEAVDSPKPQKKDIRPLTPEEVKVFLSTVKGDRLESLYILAITTGLRQGELLGLRWQDVDLNEKVVRVHQQLTRTKGGLSFSKPKNNKGRNVTLMDLAIKALMNHRERQKDEKLKMDDLWQETDLVFTSTKGTPLDASCLLKHSFRPLLKRAGLPHITFHCLRHTFATLFFSKGAHPKIVQEMLGHSNISVTMDVYSHMLPNMQGEVVRGIEENLF
ncbi:MAG: tyrosine-type recombinase/integrase, partial [Actinomycetota bacterium]|nr:tyrosine-type recombinase/integrase [Actinomycetota bacterium]